VRLREHEHEREKATRRSASLQASKATRRRGPTPCSRTLGQPPPSLPDKKWQRHLQPSTQRHLVLACWRAPARRNAGKTARLLTRQLRRISFGQRGSVRARSLSCPPVLLLPSLAPTPCGTQGYVDSSVDCTLCILLINCRVRPERVARLSAHALRNLSKVRSSSSSTYSTCTSRHQSQDWTATRHHIIEQAQSGAPQLWLLFTGVRVSSVAPAGARARRFRTMVEAASHPTHSRHNRTGQVGAWPTVQFSYPSFTA
jgi:hypothetical protein